MKTIFLLIFGLSILFFTCGQSTKSNQSAAKTDSLNFPSKVNLVSDREPGEPMIISGTIYLPDGKTPAKDAILAVWQTDATGNYITGGGGAGELHPRIHGRMKTDADGRYEFRSIKPGQYPSYTTPAHIHGHVSAPHFPEYAISYFFEGDDLITSENRSKLNGNRGGTPSIITLTKDKDGVLIGHRDFILEYVKPSSETLKLQW
jgi:protocatechuate 3,4-dioxygenase beta subunit